MKESLAATFFAMSPGHAFSQSEKAHFGVIKWCFKGTRQIVITREEAMLQFHKSRNPGSRPTFTTLWNEFKSMGSDMMAAFMANQGANCTYTCTVGAGEFLYTPAATIICERAQADHAIGLRIAILRSSDHEDLKKVFNHAEAMTLNSGGSAPRKPSILAQGVTVFANIR